MTLKALEWQDNKLFWLHHCRGFYRHGPYRWSLWWLTWFLDET